MYETFCCVPDMLYLLKSLWNPILVRLSSGCLPPHGSLGLVCIGGISLAPILHMSRSELWAWSQRLTVESR